MHVGPVRSAVPLLTNEFLVVEEVAGVGAKPL